MSSNVKPISKILCKFFETNFYFVRFWKSQIKFLGAVNVNDLDIGFTLGYFVVIGSYNIWLTSMKKLIRKDSLITGLIFG